MTNCISYHLNIENESLHASNRPYLAIHRKWAPIIKWCVVKCGCKSGHQNRQMFKGD